MRDIAAELKELRLPGMVGAWDGLKEQDESDLADFASSTVDQALVRQLATLAFTDTAQTVVLIAGPGTGKTHLATAMALSSIATKAKRVRFYSTDDLVNVMEREKRDGKAGRLALSLLRIDMVILDELGCVSFSQAGGALLFDRPTHHCHIVETRNESYRFQQSTMAAKDRIKTREQKRKAGGADTTAEASPESDKEQLKR